MIAAPAAGARTLRVLVVEDSPIGREVLARALPRINAEVTWAPNGSEALKAFGAGRFDLVLMDLRMPGMDGVTAVREMRSIEAANRAPRTPIVVVSAHSAPEDKLATFEAGADLHLAKPYDVPSLLGTIEGMTTQL
jgi:CheY-like chemotaxis protein